jgi:uracil phosphoribosyltransferase
MPAKVHVIDHPLVQHKLTLMRKRETSCASFRTLLEEISMLLAYEVTRDLPLEMHTIETPLASMEAPRLAGQKLTLVSILRAGNGLLDGMLRILPSARVGHVGLYRDHETLEAIEYYFKMPAGISERDVIMVDPMLATGGSAIAALDLVRKIEPRSLKYVCLLAAPEGIAALQEKHGDVPIFTAAIDSHLNEKGYIVPGLGDAGDRMYGTKQ